MMKHISPEEFEAHLKVLEQVKEEETDAFFYTRLRGRMQTENERGWLFGLKPAWVVGCMTVFLVANALIVVKEKRTKRTESAATIRNFATGYDQTISTPY